MTPHNLNDDNAWLVNSKKSFYISFDLPSFLVFCCLFVSFCCHVLTMMECTGKGKEGKEGTCCEGQALYLHKIGLDKMAARIQEGFMKFQHKLRLQTLVTDGCQEKETVCFKDVVLRGYTHAYTGSSTTTQTQKVSTKQSKSVREA